MGYQHDSGSGSGLPGRPTEHTPLLEADHSQQYGSKISEEDLGAAMPRKQETKDLTASDSLNIGGFGMDPESQTIIITRSGNDSASGSQSRASFDSSQRTSIDENSSLIDHVSITQISKSPYLGGVSVVQFWLIYAGVLSNSFVSTFDSTLMAATHPVITSYFHASNSASWLSVAFLLTSTSFQPLFGRLSDTIGRKPPYIFTLAVFLMGTIWCTMAQSMISFILARAVCGLGAGGMMSMSSIITSDLVPIEIRGAYQSYVHIAFGAGAALGAATGGLIADSLGWRWEFGIQIPLLALLFLIACFTTPRDLGKGAGVTSNGVWDALKVFDYGGSITLTASITFLILGLNLGGNVYAWTHPLVMTSFVLFTCFFPTFIYIETKVPKPIIPLSILTHNPRLGLIISNFFSSVITNLILFNAPLYFQAVLLESATTSGLRLLIPSLCTSVVGTCTGFLITYLQSLKWTLNLGSFLLLSGCVCLTFLQRGLPSWAYSLFLVLPSMGQGFQNPGTFMSILSVSEQKEQAVVSSTLILFRSMGMVSGVASSSLVVQNALVFYLNKFVTGQDKEKIIFQARKSVQSIGSMPDAAREQVISAYTHALKVTFQMSIILAVVVVLTILTIRLPTLKKKSTG